MKMVKSLILGSAAGLIAMSGAQAADLPVKAKAVEYVRICSLYGAGFFYIPGTDTCIKLGGYLRVDTTFNGRRLRRAGVERRIAGQHNRYATTSPPAPVWTSPSIPAPRPNTAWFAPSVEATFNWTTGTDAGSARRCVRSWHQQRWSNHSASTTRSSSSLASPSVSRLPSRTPWNGYPGNNSSFLLGGQDDVTGVNQSSLHRAVRQRRVGLDLVERSDRVQPHRRSTTPAWPGLVANAGSATAARMLPMSPATSASHAWDSF